MCKLRQFVFVVGLLTLIPAFAFANQIYSTMFPLTENPISEGGNWIGGQSAGGNLWGNVQTASGMAFGVTEPTQYGDPTAILTGVWGQNQTAQAAVELVNSTSGGSHEVELRLRNTISAGNITGYEIYCSVQDVYCDIATWGGPNGVYYNIAGYGGALTPLHNGDILSATVTGSSPVVITAYINGTQIMQVSDSGQAGWGPWTSGNPGLGFYDNVDSNWNYFGFSGYMATGNGSHATPEPGTLLMFGTFLMGTVGVLRRKLHF